MKLHFQMAEKKIIVIPEFYTQRKHHSGGRMENNIIYFGVGGTKTENVHFTEAYLNETNNLTNNNYILSIFAFVFPVLYLQYERN